MARYSTMRFIAKLGLGLFALGCGGETTDGVGGESHFACAKDSDCAEHGAGLLCVSGECRSGHALGTSDGGSTAERCMSACCPEAAECYVDGNPGVGASCIARRDNSPSVTQRVQLRTTWVRDVRPEVLASGLSYWVRQQFATLNWPDCGDYGNAGLVQLLDFDLAHEDPSEHTLRIGQAARAESNGAGALSTGLCMLDTLYGDTGYALPSTELGSTASWPMGLPPPRSLPWDIRPLIAKRRVNDFDVNVERSALLAELEAEQTNGTFYFNQETRTFHAYLPALYQTAIDAYASSRPLTLPLREVELTGAFEDHTRTCVGSYLGKEPEDDCTPSQGPLEAAWGCRDGACPRGEGPARMTGYILLTEAEQAYSTAGNQTLCGAAFGEEFNGPTCRESPTWNPADPSNGLPLGDWCAATNSPATQDCHDALRFESFLTYSAFPIRDGTCQQ